MTSIRTDQISGKFDRIRIRSGHCTGRDK